MRRLSVAVCVLLLAGEADAQYGEQITVERILLDVRVTDLAGEPVTGLTADDFTVTIGRRRANIESVTWIEDAPASRSSSGSAEERTQPPPRNSEEPRGTPKNPTTGRLLIVFVQTDFARNPARMTGQMHFRRYAEEFVMALQPEDRVAVFSFDSHLKFRLDFTEDKEQVAEAIRVSILIDDPPPPPHVPQPSFATRLDRNAMRRAASSEAALRLIGNALRDVEGPKSLLLIGWGLGERKVGAIGMKPQWDAAWAALDAARVSIFAFDVTWVDYHDLEIGLSRAAEQTGGFYAKTPNFPEVAISRLQRTLAGHYEIELRRPARLKRGRHEVTVRVNRRGAVVLAPQRHVDRGS